jgi:V/A-type H+-transporting ATPase subunit A
MTVTAIHTFSDEAFDALDAGVPVDEVISVDAIPRLNRIGVQEEYAEYIETLKTDIKEQIRELY